MEDEKKTKLVQWYDERYAINCAFCIKIRGLIEDIIKAKSIAYQSITSRVKEKDSFLKKSENEKYTEPVKQIMDINGIRIIAYTNSDVKKICGLLEKEFTIDPDNSENKATKMKDNEVGYLSVHYIASLSDSRTGLSEYSLYKDMKYEIQVRTLLQHAWAEIEHDRNYKFGGVLPKEIKRRFFLAAGTLEMVDREFQSLSDDIDAYSKYVKEKTTRGVLTISIDSTSLFQYLSKSLDSPKIDKTFNTLDKEIIHELSCFGINTLADLDKIIPSDYITNLNKFACTTNFCGALRDFMIIRDYKKYFDECWDKDWIGIDSEEFYGHYGLPIQDIITKYNLIAGYVNESDGYCD